MGVVLIPARVLVGLALAWVLLGLLVVAVSYHVWPVALLSAPARRLAKRWL